jgi:hypothetical protein
VLSWTGGLSGGSVKLFLVEGVEEHQQVVEFTNSAGVPLGAVPNDGSFHWTVPYSSNFTHNMVLVISTADSGNYDSSSKLAIVPDVTAAESFAWQVGAWGECSKPCGGGTQNRQYTCKSNVGITADDSQCSGFEGSAQQPCNPQACPIYAWAPGPWGSCSVSCGGGVQTRTMQCLENATEPDGANVMLETYPDMCNASGLQYGNRTEIVEYGEYGNITVVQPESYQDCASHECDPEIEITSPAACEALAVASGLELKWTGGKHDGSVLIRVTMDDGYTWETMEGLPGFDQALPNSGRFLWGVPGSTETFRLKIADTSDPDGNYDITPNITIANHSMQSLSFVAAVPAPGQPLAPAPEPGSGGALIGGVVAAVLVLVLGLFWYWFKGQSKDMQLFEAAYFKMLFSSCTQRITNLPSTCSTMFSGMMRSARKFLMLCCMKFTHDTQRNSMERGSSLRQSSLDRQCKGATSNMDSFGAVNPMSSRNLDSGLSSTKTPGGNVVQLTKQLAEKHEIVKKKRLTGLEGGTSGAIAAVIAALPQHSQAQSSRKLPGKEPLGHREVRAVSTAENPSAEL